MSLTASLIAFFINDTSEWLAGPDGDQKTRNLAEAIVIRPEEVEQFLKDKHILTKHKSLSMHVLEANFVLKRRIKLN